jgi:hypothetical protein
MDSAESFLPHRGAKGVANLQRAAWLTQSEFKGKDECTRAEPDEMKKPQRSATATRIRGQA